MLSLEDTLLHIRLAKKGNEDSKEILVKNNILLVKSIVNKFKNKGVDYDDLIQIGSLGLIKAVYNFDESYKVRFSTYAVPLIIGEIKRFLRDDGEIKVSRFIKLQAQNINNYIEKFQIKHGIEPTIEEIASALNYSKEDVVLAIDSSKMPISLYETVDDGLEKSQELIEKLPSKESEDDIVNKLYVKNLLKKLK